MASAIRVAPLIKYGSKLRESIFLDKFNFNFVFPSIIYVTVGD